MKNPTEGQVCDCENTGYRLSGSRAAPPARVTVDRDRPSRFSVVIMVIMS